jgi:hypothetical protein
VGERAVNDVIGRSTKPRGFAFTERRGRPFPHAADGVRGHPRVTLLPDGKPAT